MPTLEELADVREMSLRQIAEREVRQERAERRRARLKAMHFSGTTIREGDIADAYLDDRWWPGTRIPGVTEWGEVVDFGGPQFLDHERVWAGGKRCRE